MTNPLEQTIAIEKLSFGDWLAVAVAKDNSLNWGFYSWLENCDSDVLKGLTREQIEQIADRLSSEVSWVMRKINEYS